MPLPDDAPPDGHRVCALCHDNVSPWAGLAMLRPWWITLGLVGPLGLVLGLVGALDGPWRSALLTGLGLMLVAGMVATRRRHQLHEAERTALWDEGPQWSVRIGARRVWSGPAPKAGTVRTGMYTVLGRAQVRQLPVLAIGTKAQPLVLGVLDAVPWRHAGPALPPPQYLVDHANWQRLAPRLHLAAAPRRA